MSWLGDDGDVEDGLGWLLDVDEVEDGLAMTTTSRMTRR